MSGQPAKDCVRCGRSAKAGRNWPEGFVCMSCLRAGARRRGHCPSCDIDRLLVGLDGKGRPICVDCAGITTSYLCATCGREDERWFARTCLRCSLHRRLAQLLDDGSGAVAQALVPLAEALGAMADPWPGLAWLATPAVAERLGLLATGAVALTHEGIDQLQPGPGREYLRDLLVVHKVLPARDKYLAAFQRWTVSRLETIEDPNDRQLVRTYLRWHHHRDLSARAAVGPLPSTVVARARAKTNSGLALLAWLRSRGVSLGQCRQADLDAWLSSGSNPRQALDFLTWAIRHRHCPALVIPSRQRRSPGAANPKELSEVLARLLSDDELELGDRVAGGLVVLLAQPLTRICALTLADVESRDDEVWVRLGDDRVPLPEQLGSLVARLTGQRRNMTTAANPASPWLFPGQSPGQAMGVTRLGERLAALGVTSRGRVGAFNQLVSDVPAPVLAKALGYHPHTAATRAAELGTDWAAYAALKAREKALN